MRQLLNRLKGDRRKLPGVRSEAAFHEILEQQRALADRHGRQFALLVFALPRLTDERELMRRLRVALTERIRKTDMAGWMPERQIGIVLPYSHQQGANVVAQAIRRELGDLAPLVDFKVLLYPADNAPGSGGTRGGGELRREDGSGGHPENNHAARAAAATVVTADIPETPSAEVLALLAPPVPPWKRAVDVLAALVALVVFSPVMLAIAALIKIVSPGPIFFRQERIGHLGRKFTCWKFRTMHVQADPAVHADHLAHLIKDDVPMTKLDVRKDGRVIPFGRVLRAAGLDELPQLFNVLKGDMSLVGPRPCIEYEYESYQLWHKRRFDTLPGLTGLWQVSGKNRTTFSEMMRLDVAYSQKKTLRRDLSIVWRTIPAVIGEIRLMMSAKRRLVHEKGN